MRSFNFRSVNLTPIHLLSKLKVALTIGILLLALKERNSKFSLIRV